MRGYLDVVVSINPPQPSDLQQTKLANKGELGADRHRCLPRPHFHDPGMVPGVQRLQATHGSVRVPYLNPAGPEPISCARFVIPTIF
ncbi:hypothetical protein HPP92_014810 [Vanilla planifolia]|uniref:Uncharacterized protein n=1 Tax=Vanilla planifolia TaxID=51239 RepID=A0A835QS94_VANPL|nr:hypothetical protein HPP92_014810 [Vanilla planifolia]